MTEYQKAKAWRERVAGTGHAGRVKLGELTGFAPETIYWYERGINPPRGKRRPQGPISDFVWHRYRLVCSGLQAQLDGRKFNW